MDQTAEILVGIADKNYLRGDKTAYFSILTGTDGCKLENIPGSWQDYLFYELNKEIDYKASFSLPVGDLLLQMKQIIRTYHLESGWNNYAGKVKEKYEIII